jgi:hypothetical protein
MERGDRHRVVEPRAAVRNPQLDGRMLQGGPDRPPDVAGVGNDAGVPERADIFLVFGLVAQRLRQAGARQLVIGRQAVAVQAGAKTLPERRGRAQREQQRQERHQPLHQLDAAIGIGRRDVDVHAAQHVAHADHLQIAHDGVVARLRRLLLFSPEGERKGPDRRDAEPAGAG